MMAPVAAPVPGAPPAYYAGGPGAGYLPGQAQMPYLPPAGPAAAPYPPAGYPASAYPPAQYPQGPIEPPPPPYKN